MMCPIARPIAYLQLAVLSLAEKSPSHSLLPLLLLHLVWHGAFVYIRLRHVAHSRRPHAVWGQITLQPALLASELSRAHVCVCVSRFCIHQSNLHHVQIKWQRSRCVAACGGSRQTHCHASRCFCKRSRGISSSCRSSVLPRRRRERSPWACSVV